MITYNRLYDKFNDVCKAFHAHDVASAELRMRIADMFEEYAAWRVAQANEAHKKETGQ